MLTLIGGLSAAVRYNDSEGVKSMISMNLKKLRNRYRYTQEEVDLP